MAIRRYLVTLFLSLLLNPWILPKQLNHQAPPEVAPELGTVDESENTGEDNTFWKRLYFGSWKHWNFIPSKLLQLLTVIGSLFMFYCLSLCLKKWWCAPDNSKKEPEEEEDDDNEDVEEVLHSDAIYLRRIQWPGLNLAYRSQEVMHLMGDLLKAYQECFTQRFSPLLQPAIGIGSAFEGWSPSGDDTVYQVLLPLKPCPGYEFHVELGRAEKTPARDGRIHVELECTCSRKKSLCSLHNPEEMIRKRRGSSFLESLCTDSYLNVQKTVVCFQSFVKSAWATLPQSHCYKVQLLPSGHSCKLKLQKASRRTIIIEMLMGMQLADSDIFLCSQDTGAAISSSTTWALSCAVAEMKFFRLASRQVPHGSCHLRCLYACTRIAQGTCFSTYIFKTVMMHLLATTPPSGWSMENFPQRLDDTMRYLHRCLQEKRLNHFCFGNENIPGGIVLPLAFREAQPPNLLQHLQDGDAHTESLQELKKLRFQLVRLIIYGL